MKKRALLVGVVLLGAVALLAFAWARGRAEQERQAAEITALRAEIQTLQDDVVVLACLESMVTEMMVSSATGEVVRVDASMAECAAQPTLRRGEGVSEFALAATQDSLQYFPLARRASAFREWFGMEQRVGQIGPEQP